MMKRDNNFDGLRLIGAMLVLASHMIYLSLRPEPMVYGKHSLGNLGVLIFFAISGYLVAASWARDPDLGRFLEKRYRRIFPGVVVAVISTWLLFELLVAVSPQGTFQLYNNRPLWTIPIEATCYLILAGIAMVFPHRELVLALAMLAAFKFGPTSFISYFGLFFATGALFHAYPRLLRWRYLPLWLLAFYICRNHTKVALAMVVPYLTIMIGIRSWPVLRSFGRFGDLSYGTYIYAWPVQQIAVALLGRELLWPLYAFSVPITLSLAWLSWRFVEAPCLRRSPPAKLPQPELISDKAHLQAK